MSTAFAVCFWVGLILLLVGSFQGHGHGFGHAGGGGHFDTGASAGHGGLLLSPLPLLVLLTVWGGVGFLLLQLSSFGLGIVLVLCTVTALAAGAVIYYLLSRLMSRYDNSMKQEEYELEGQLGYLSVPVSGPAIGEMKYVLHGTTRSVSVRSETGEFLAKGTKVIIVRLEKGIAVVIAFESITSRLH